ncbi:hypothetical protein EJ04DRAFT_514212 [Polyplosphaeria fusca]|uniref:Uncharacterized protein n=1 Tax=Polyplosphaeria fusca TaxID=682080 RepID=A0A9P4QVL9_9PLEO|nr:hypothetical protein EJ04DRAFT_514212 [Polyplosphaeria fusca]
MDDPNALGPSDVKLKHISTALEKVEPFHLRMRLQRQRFAGNAQLNPYAEAQALISRTVAIYLILHLSYLVLF